MTGETSIGSLEIFTQDGTFAGVDEVQFGAGTGSASRSFQTAYFDPTTCRNRPRRWRGWGSR